MAIYANLVADQGSDFISKITVEGAAGLSSDLTGYTAKGQVRKTYSSTTQYDLHATVDADPTTGIIDINLTASQTASMRAGRYVYDVEITSSTGVVTRVVEGQIEITPRVTR